MKPTRSPGARIRARFSVRAGLAFACALAAVTAALTPWRCAAQGQVFITDTAEQVAQARLLQADLLAQRPVNRSEITGFFKIRDAAGRRSSVPVRFVVEPLGDAAWRSTYEAILPAAGTVERLSVTHVEAQPSSYALRREGAEPVTLESTAAMWTAFAGSDFFAADLGLEFLRWPDQRLLRKELRKSRACRVLESRNPAPGQGGYARVLSWIDADTGGVLCAEAFDAAGRMVKEFSVRSFKKVEGRWQLKEMEIRDLIRDSRTTMEFDLELPAR
jgi:hypothetical protein